MLWKPMVWRKSVSGVESRQGFLDRPVLVVLAVSLGLAALVFGVMLLRIVSA
jgi:hypothetical protein